MSHVKSYVWYMAKVMFGKSQGRLALPLRARVDDIDPLYEAPTIQLSMRQMTNLGFGFSCGRVLLETECGSVSARVWSKWSSMYPRHNDNVQLSRGAAEKLGVQQGDYVSIVGTKGALPLTPMSDL